MTRTVAVGKPDQFKQDIYNLTLEAHMTAVKYWLKLVWPLVKLTMLGLSVIEAGYGEYFNHRLGHGLGMSVHEFPSIMEGNDLVIKEGMCFSVEPGIYIPGKVGVRIEDTAVMSQKLDLNSSQKHQKNSSVFWRLMEPNRFFTPQSSLATVPFDVK